MSGVNSNEEAFIRRTPPARTRSPFTLPARWLLLFTLLWVLLAGLKLYGQEPRPTEYDVKAAYLYNFGRFVAWPGVGDGFTICVLGQDPFGSALDATLAGQTIKNKRVVAKRIATSQDSADCQILFISSGEDGRLAEIIGALDKKPILTVSDMPQFSDRGGMIQFISEGKRIRFEVNLTAAQNAGLTLSSDLLKVATAVKRNRSPGD